MNDSKALFEEISQNLIANDQTVNLGKMMSAPGLKYKDKIFAFYHKQKMGFRLGKEFDPASMHISDWDWLSPFKTKPPLKAWFMIPETLADRWPELAERALEFTKTLK